jgi:hypothetical protein
MKWWVRGYIDASSSYGRKDGYCIRLLSRKTIRKYRSQTLCLCSRCVITLNGDCKGGVAYSK